MRIVIAKTSVWLDQFMMIRKGQAWDAEHPLVKKHPEYFTDDDPSLLDHPAPVVEAMTAAPGEKRATARRA